MSEKNGQTIYSLYSIIKKYEIRIPIIQRDYAQGRNNEKSKEVRKRLLDDMISVLDSEDKHLDFNFVYGNVNEDIFYPVDGQQRLTTLYLLHWFLSCRISKECLDKFNSLKRFSYMTRNSAAEFFRMLKNPNNELIDIIRNKCAFREKIIDYPWFRAEWNNDPTIISVLNILDDMNKDERFYNKEEKYYSRLIDDDDPAIYFTMLNEENENAEAAAAVKYIRMNARGKLLTVFENVKAMLDGIDRKLGDEVTEIIYDYDVEFIDFFYNKVGNEGSLKDRTESIDNNTMNFFRNMYNITVTVWKNELQIFWDNVSFANKMYEYSQNVNEDVIRMFKTYFNMMEAVLRFCTYYDKDQSFITNIFEDDFFIDNDNRNNKFEVAYFLYLYYLYKKHIELGKKKEDFKITDFGIEKFKYVLMNLKYEEWNDNQFTTVNKLAIILSEYNDIFDYFAKVDSKKIINSILDNNIEYVKDINQRIIEQHIKAYIIKYKNWEYNYFYELEKRCEERKIQYLLWISDLWNKDTIDLNNINILEQYMKIAIKYFYNKDTELEWRKLFAIAGNWNEQVNRLYTSKEINEILTKQWEINSFWNDEEYFWNDEENINIEKLNIIKRSYQLISTYGKDELFDKVKNDLDNTCWLKYAILRNYKELLTKEVRYRNDSLIVKFGYDDKWKKFMLYVLLLDTKLEIKQTEYNYKYDRNVCGFGKCKFICEICDSWRFIENYPYKDSTGKYTHKDWRGYNISLNGCAEYIIANNIVNLDNTCYIVDEKNNQYELYEYNEKNNEFSKYTYKYSYIKEFITKEIILLKEELNKINIDFKNGDYDKILKIRNYSDNEWIHDGGNKHSWTKKISSEFHNMDFANLYKLNI